MSELSNLYMREWRKQNPAWDLKNNQRLSSNYQKYKAQVFELLGNSCVKCGFSDKRALQIDHIYGNGNKERNNRGYGYTFFKMILTDPNAKSKYQILCANCNWIKRAENGEGRRR